MLYSAPLESDPSTPSCNLKRLRNVLPLSLVGGSAQLVTYALGAVSRKRVQRPLAQYV